VLKAKDIMNSQVVTIGGSSTVADAVSLMKGNRTNVLIVARRNSDDPYGIVTETDIVYKVAAYGKDPKHVRVYEIMTKPCIVVSPDLGVEYVARLLANTGIHQAPVIQGELLGVISITDVLHKGNFVEKPRRPYIEDEIEAAREDARQIALLKGETSPEAAAAWDVVEELQAEASHRRNQDSSMENSAGQSAAEPAEKTAFQIYCDTNPDAPECRIYDE
jgi:CBS domain-containing protein